MSTLRAGTLPYEYYVYLTSAIAPSLFLRSFTESLVPDLLLHHFRVVVHHAIAHGFQTDDL